MPDAHAGNFVTRHGDELSDEEIRARDASCLPRSSVVHDHLVWREAHGCLVYDQEGRELIDFSSGVLVTNIGHSHPAVAEAIARQARTFLNAYDAPHPLRTELAERLLELAGRPPYTSVALLTTGSEAIDAALRIARAVTRRHGVVAFSSGFHGRTLTSLAIGGIPSVRRGMGPAWPGVVVAPFPDLYRPPADVGEGSLGEWCISAARDLVATNLSDEPAAVIVEPYLGTGGALVPPPGFMALLRKFADEYGALFILDEVQSSFGRTGTWFAFQGLGVQPDIVVVAKAIASGVPISPLITRRELVDAMPPGSLWNTFGGNPLACAAALATIDVLENPDCCRASRLSVTPSQRESVGGCPGSR